MKIGDEPIRRRCEIALSTFDEHQRRLQENRFTDAVLSCLWLKLVRGVGAYQPIDEMKISGGRSDSRKWTDHRVNWRRTTLVSEVFLEIFLRERESEPPSGDNESRRGEEREKPLSLLVASGLVVSEQCWLVRSFAKKIFKKNLWAQSSGEPIRRWFKNRPTGSPYRWTRS